MADILVIEPLASGHRLQHPRRVVRELLSRGHTVRLATFTSSMANPVFRTMKEEFGDRFCEIAIPEQTRWSRLIHANRWVARNVGYFGLYRDFYRKTLTNEKIDQIFLPSLEYCMIMIALRGSPFGEIPFSGMVMELALGLGNSGIIATPPRYHRIKEKLLLRMLRTKKLEHVFTIVLPMADYFQKRYPQIANKLIYVPDPVDPLSPNPEARKMLGIESGKKILLVYGELCKRKGIEYLLDATKEEEFPKDVCLFMAGVQYPEIDACMASSQTQRLRQRGCLIEINEYLDDEAERNVFSAADAVWLGYKDFYVSSGVLYLSAAMGCPVIACQEGIVGWETKRHKLGPVIDVRKALEVAAAVKNMFNDKDAYQEYGENGLRLAKAHSTSDFVRQICDVTEQGL